MEKIQEIEKTSGMDDLGIDFLTHMIFACKLKFVTFVDPKKYITLA